MTVKMLAARRLAGPAVSRASHRPSSWLASSLEGTPNALLYHAADPAADATTRGRARDVASAQGGGAAGKEC